MESNRTILLCILGISLLPKIYSDTYPSLIIKKKNKNYTVADEIQYVDDQNDALKFSTSPQYKLYYACPEENAPIHQTYALKIQKLVTDFEARPLQQFVEGDFDNYNCSNPIKAIALKSKKRFPNKALHEYHLGFLIHEKNGNFDKLSEKYENFTETQEYDFLHFVTILIDEQTGTTLETRHQMVSRGLLEPDPAYSGPFQPNEKNVNIYRFDISSLYTEKTQRKAFSNAFPEGYSHCYSYPNKSLRKVQLVPHEDFPLNTWKLTTFMDINTTAMWEQLYLQWRRIEIFVRQVARELGALTIDTGVSRILTLTDAFGNKRRPIHFRRNRKFPVRRYIWKLIKLRPSNDDVKNRAILIVMHNDPYTPDQEPICDDVSENWGWMLSNNDYKTGLTYGCQVVENITTKLYNEFKVNYPSLNLNNVKKLEHDKNETYPSLFVIKKSNNNYAVADKFQYVEGEKNVLKFTTSAEYQLYNACPEKYAPFYQTYALNVQESVTDFKGSPLQQFVNGDFAKYNCSNPLKPIVLKSKKKFKSNVVNEYHLGFLIHEKNGNFDELSTRYENFIKIREYNFLQFVTIRRDQQSGTTLETCHQIVSRGLLKPDSAYSGPLQPNEKNIDIYGFDVDSLYTEENQRSVFTSLFPERYSLYYSYPNKSLRKVQLVPHEDFPLNTWKSPSLMDINTTAMWEQLYPQWRRIEIFVRKVARKLGTVNVETGAARVLNLHNARKKIQSVYLLEGGKFPVRKYIWKQITFTPSGNVGNIQAILIIMHNDPYSENQTPICDDVSENSGWMVSNKDYKTGLTYVCPVVEKTAMKLYNLKKVNYPCLNLNNVQNFGYNENDIFPPLFLIKNPNTFYSVADQFEYVEGEDSMLKFSTAPRYQLYNACPEENAHFLQTYALKVQALVTDFEASPLQQLVEGDFVEYNCRMPVKPIVLKSKQSVEDTFEVQYDIGFLIYEKNGNFDKLSEIYENFTETREYDFIRLLAIIMDRQSGITISVIHRIISGGLLEPESEYTAAFHPNEKNVDVYGFDIDYLYTEQHQRKMFTAIFGQSYTDYYNPSNQSLRKVQLAPYEDFLLNTWKLTSFMDLNTTAMWEQLYPQWKRIEIFVRKVALELEALTIVTGAAKILTLADVEGQQKPVYLRARQRAPVPKYIWKLVRFDQLDDDYYSQAILIVMHNDPYNPNQEPICDDVSENWGWVVSNKDYTTGLTYGCQVIGNITSELLNEYKMNYASLNLNNVQKFEYDENDIFPSFFVMKKPNKVHVVADKFQYVGGQDRLLKFSTPPEYHLYRACPEENALFYPTYALKVQELVKDFEASPLQQFVEGDFVKYNCWYPIKPIVLKSKQRLKDEFAVQYDIGFLIHESNGNFNKLSEKYENFTEIPEYDFLPFLAITMNRQSGAIISVLHKIISRGVLEPESAYSAPFQADEKNVDVYGFDVNSLYTEENQQKIFSSIFGERYTDYYNPSNQGLRKVQLAPYEDFILNTWKLPSFMDLNTTAIWEQLHLQWRKIEIFVRKVARQMEVLTIETGAARTLSLPDAEGTQRPVYLREGKKSPVPKYLWKSIMFDQPTNNIYTQAILIIMHNDPYNQNQEPICDDVSESLGWMVSNKDYKTGLTYVCPVNENITSKLHDEYNENHENFDLKAVHKLEYDRNGLVKWVDENVYLKVMSRS